MPTCLIVDDDTQILDYVAKHVQNESIDTAIHENAESALKYLEHNQVDIAIVDIMMDGMNGFELCQHLKEDYQLPVICSLHVMP